MTTATSALQPGTLVITTTVDGEDFGLPLVSPTHRPGRGAEVRQVRNTCRTRNGTVIWFADGSKSRPVHGRTTWTTR